MIDPIVVKVCFARFVSTVQGKSQDVFEVVPLTPHKISVITEGNHKISGFGLVFCFWLFNWGIRGFLLHIYTFHVLSGKLVTFPRLVIIAHA